MPAARIDKKQLKTAAAISLAAMVWLCVSSWMGVWQTRYQVVSPLVPATIVESIVRPYRIAGMILLPVAGISALCYRCRKYVPVIVAGIASVIVWQVYFA